MRHLLTFFLFLLTALSVNGQNQTVLQVKIAGCKPLQGQLLCSLFNSETGYPDQPQRAFKIASVRVTDTLVRLVFRDIPVGTYAVAILHDKNEDGRMNTTLLGLPKEGYGFSNNAMGLMGPPSFNKASFTVGPQEKTISIRLRY